MVKVFDVDKGEFVCEVNSSMNFSQVLEKVSQPTNIPHNQIVLMTDDGLCLDQTKDFSQYLTDSLFLFRKNQVKIDCVNPKKPWQQYSYPPGMDWYEKRFDFEDYEEFPEGYKEIPTIEERLFQLSETSRKLYAEYLVSKEYLESSKDLLQVRISASEALLKNLENYYREVKNQWNELFKKSTELQKEVTEAHGTFNEQLKNLESSSFGVQVDSLVRDGNFKRFGMNIYVKVGNFFHKVSSLKTEVLKKVKQELGDSSFSLEQVKFKVEDSLNQLNELKENKTLDKYEVEFSFGLSCITTYNEFRENLEKVCDPKTKGRREIANTLLSSGEMLHELNEQQSKLQTILDEMVRHEYDIKDNLKRVQGFYKGKVIEVVVKNTYHLKYLVKEKLNKLGHKYFQLTTQKEFLYVPTKLEEACHAARNQLQETQERSNRIKQLYVALCQAIIDDQGKKSHFLEQYGSILPKSAFPELASVALDQSKLRPILNFNSEEKEATSEEMPELPSSAIVEHYEKELLKQEVKTNNVRNKFQQSQNQLENDLLRLSKLLNEQKREKERLEGLINNYSEELELLRSGGGEDILRKFQQEVRRLSEREAAFKRGYLENLKVLRNENKRLKEELSKLK